MEKTFLYIDILGFKNLVTSKSSKLESIFRIIDSLHVHKDVAFQTIVFSDTILIFNKNNEYPLHYHITYLIEYAQQLFYKLSMINVYFKGIITLKSFTYIEMQNLNAYYGEALISTYQDEKELKGFGVYIDKSISNESLIFDKIGFNEKYDYILLCQSLTKLYRETKGELPISKSILTETDDYYRIDEDLRFLREIDYFRKHINDDRVRKNIIMFIMYISLCYLSFLMFLKKKDFYHS